MTTQNDLSGFDDNAVVIASRQYLNEGETLSQMFRRVAQAVAAVEAPDVRDDYENLFYNLMASKRFCPGGRILAGAGSAHGNMLNCFVQSASPLDPATNEGVMHLAEKLALVTKTGGGNGVNLDDLPPKAENPWTVGQALIYIAPAHQDAQKVAAGTYFNITHGKDVTVGYRTAQVVYDFDLWDDDAHHIVVPDSIAGIWAAGARMLEYLLLGQDVVVDLSGLRPEGSGVSGSGGKSSGPQSFAVEVFDNFATYAALGGAAYAGPVAALRYVFAPTLRVVRQGGSRRGAGLASMQATNPDISDFITCKDLAREETEGDISTFNISVLVNDAFMQDATQQDTMASSQLVLEAVAEHAWATGEPGLIFVDTLNRYNPLLDKLGPIVTTNPCFPAGTMVLTKAGHYPIEELVGQTVEVWDGEAWREIRNFRVTGTDEKLSEVRLKDGRTVRATGYHPFILEDGKRKKLLQLLPGDRLKVHDLALHGDPKPKEAVVSAINPSVGVADKVYCCTVEGSHAFSLSSGLVVGQCGEIPLYPGEPCCLGALNLAAYVNRSGRFDDTEFKRDVRVAVRFLDNVLEVNKFALEDNREMSQRYRRLGLGVMGMADMLILLGERYDSASGRAHIQSIMAKLRATALKESKALASERGSFPGFDDSDLDTETPRRNVAALTVAPTGTTSMLFGVSSGIEPIFAPFIYRRVGDEYLTMVSPLFQKLLEDHEPHPDYVRFVPTVIGGDTFGWNLEKVTQAIQDNHGSVQGLEFVPEAVRNVFVCAHDVAPADHVKMQGVIQRTFDEEGKVANSLSKTINMPNSATVKNVLDAYTLAHAEGCKGVTVYRDGSRQFQVLSTSTSANEEVEEEQAQTVDTIRTIADGVIGHVVTGNGTREFHPNEGAAEIAEAKEMGDVFDEQLETLEVQVGPIDNPVKEPEQLGKTTGNLSLESTETPTERPTRATGFTDKAQMTDVSGNKRGYFVTVNAWDGSTREVFVSAGKGGDEENGDAEALGRLVSIALQHGIPAADLIKTLRGISGGMYGTYQGRIVHSKADLIAVALETAETAPTSDPNGFLMVKNYLDNVNDQVFAAEVRGVPQGNCPQGCGCDLIREEGCMKCPCCGYSKCG